MGNILIIEDEEHVRKLMELVLVREGHKVKQASGAEEAFTILNDEQGQDDKTELILLDLRLGDTDGLKILQKIKSSDEMRLISVMLITSISQQSIVLQGIKLGAEGYIKKPDCCFSSFFIFKRGCSG